jgi:hypothetical protein
MKMAEKREQLFVPPVPIFVPVWKAGSLGSSGVEFGDATFYSPAEMSAREAMPYGSREREDVPQSAA